MNADAAFPARSARDLELVEEQDSYVPRDRLGPDEALELHRRWGHRVTVEWPSPRTGDEFVLRSHGTVGVLPVHEGLLVRIVPKAPIASVFRMLEVAYDLPSFQALHDPFRGNRVDDLFETLVELLCKRVLARQQKGLHKDYVEHRETLACVRGRLDPFRTARELLSGGTALHCDFADLSVDLPENRILLSTLHRLRTTPLQRDDVRKLVRLAYRGLVADVSLQSLRAGDVAAMTYHPAIADYRPMHALCRLLLDACGVESAAGPTEGLAFALSMPALFEAYVARWLEARLGGDLDVVPQLRAPLDGRDSLAFRIDVVLSDPATRRVVAVLDTKYKTAPEPALGDVQQIVAYAVRMGTATGVLVTPGGDDGELRVGGVRVLFRGIALTDLESEKNHRIVRELAGLPAAPRSATTAR